MCVIDDGVIYSQNQLKIPEMAIDVRGQWKVWIVTAGGESRGSWSGLYLFFTIFTDL
jgi:hypothetical protein